MAPEDPIIEAIDRAYRRANPGQEVPWTQTALVRLRREMERVAAAGIEEWIEAVENRFATPGITTGELPETFIPYLSTYMERQIISENGAFSFQLDPSFANINLTTNQFPETGNRNGRETNMAVIRKKEAKKDSDAVAKPKGKRGRPSKEELARRAEEAAGQTVEIETDEEATSTETALAKIEDPVVVMVNKATPEGFTKAAVREAQRLDEKIVKTIDRLKKDYVVLGQMFNEMHKKGYHRALGFNRFEDYMRDRYPDQGKSQVFQAMRVVRELGPGEDGSKPTVSDDDLREMPRDNAEGLAKLKKAGHTITPQLIEDAKTLPIKRFQEEILMPMTPERQAAAGEAAVPAAEPEVMVRRAFTLSGSVASRLAKAVEIAEYISGGRQGTESFDDRVIDTIVGEFLSTYEADYEEMKKGQGREAHHRATVAQDEIGPEVPESEANEYRVLEVDVPELEEEQHVEEIAAPDSDTPEATDEVAAEVNETIL